MFILIIGTVDAVMFSDVILCPISNLVYIIIVLLFYITLLGFIGLGIY